MVLGRFRTEREWNRSEHSQECLELVRVQPEPPQKACSITMAHTEALEIVLDYESKKEYIVISLECNQGKKEVKELAMA